MSSRAELALILGKLPSELTPDKISFEEVIFLLHIHRKKEAEKTAQFLENLGYQLGIYWKLEDLKENLTPQPKIVQDKVMLPLSVAVAVSGMNPKALFNTINDLKTKGYNSNKAVDAQLNANELTKEQYKFLFDRKKKV